MCKQLTSFWNLLPADTPGNYPRHFVMPEFLLTNGRLYNSYSMTILIRRNTVHTQLQYMYSVCMYIYIHAPSVSEKSSRQCGQGHVGSHGKSQFLSDRMPGTEKKNKKQKQKAETAGVLFEIAIYGDTRRESNFDGFILICFLIFYTDFHLHPEHGQDITAGLWWNMNKPYFSQFMSQFMQIGLFLDMPHSVSIRLTEDTPDV